MDISELVNEYLKNKEVKKIGRPNKPWVTKGQGIIEIHLYGESISVL